MEAVATTEKEISDSEVKQTSVGIETVAPKESTEIARLRKELGLPEISPLLPGRDEVKQARARKIEGYIEEREQKIFLQNKEGFIDRSKEWRDGFRKFAPEETRPKDLVGKLNRFTTINFLKLRGVKDAEEKVSSLEKINTPNYSRLREEQIVNGLKNIQNLDLAISRVEQIGYHFEDDYFRSRDFTDALQVLESLQDVQFEDIAGQLNKYFFLQKNGNFVDYTDYNKPSLTPDFVAVASIFKNGGLQPEQKERLEQAYQFAILIGRVPLADKNGKLDDYNVSDEFHSLSIDDVLNKSLDGTRAEELLNAVQNAVFGDRGKQNFEVTAFFFYCADKLNTRGQMNALNELVNSGWDCRDIYNKCSRGSYAYEGEISESIKMISKARDINSDPEKMEWVALFNELSGVKSLSFRDIDDYEQMYEKREALSGLAVLAKALNADFGEMTHYDSRDRKFGIQSEYIGGLLGNLDLDKVPPKEKDFWMFIKQTFPKLGSWAGNLIVDTEDSLFLGYLVREKSNFDQLFVNVVSNGGRFQEFQPQVKFIEGILSGEIKMSGERKDRFIVNYDDVKNIEPALALAHFDIFGSYQQIRIILSLPDGYLNSLSTEEGELYRFLRDNLNKDSSFPMIFFLNHKDKFGDYVKQGAIQPQFLYDFFNSPENVGMFTDFLEDKYVNFFPEKEKIFWTFFRGKNYDIQLFILDRVKNQSWLSYVSETGDINEKKVVRDFFHDIRARPEDCRTYETLTDLFIDLQSQHPKGEELGLLYLKIAAAHRLRTIGNVRTGVEAIGRMKDAFAGLYHNGMTPFEKLSWEVLRRQLPFAANVNVQANMRNQALVVEQLNRDKLSWVHQSVHNYASVFEVPYLQSFKTFLETGDKTDLESFRNMFAGEARAPDYTEEDRQVFLELNINVIPELDKLIEFVGSFYGINAQSLRWLMGAEVFVGDVGSDDELKKLSKELVEKDLPILQESLSIVSEEGKQRALHFSFNVNKLRRQVSRVLQDDEGGESSFKTDTLVTDTILDDLSKNVFTKYKDFLGQNEDKLTTNDIFESVVVLGNVVTAAYFNGEVSEETFRKARTFLQFAYPESITPQFFQVARLLFPVLRQEIDSYWEKFTAVGAPEMVEMLTRTGLSREEAEQRVFFTDLVDFKKSSMVFVLEPMMNLVEESLAKIAPNYEVSIPDVKGAYTRATGENFYASKGDYTNSEVTSFIESVFTKEMPNDMAQASQFLGELAQSSEAQAEKITRAVIAGYIDKDKLKTYHQTIIKNGNTIEFFPFSFYGVDMVVILENGHRVENPKEFILKNFSVPKVIVNSLREGD